MELKFIQLEECGDGRPIVKVVLSLKIGRRLALPLVAPVVNMNDDLKAESKQKPATQRK
jgi:hypothetical protein